MHPTISELEADLSEAVLFFTNDDIATGLPFMHYFPKNCCEVVTAFLSHTLHKKYPGARVVRVQGEDPLHNEAHFWVEVNDLVIDPTCQQFQSYIKPLVGDRPSPLTERFSKIEEQSPEQAWDVFMKNEVLNRLYAKPANSPCRGMASCPMI